MAWRDQSWNQWHSKKAKGTRKSEAKDPKETAKRFPSYDHGGAGGGSASSSTGNAPPDQQLVQALMACAAKDKSLAAIVEQVVPGTLTEEQELKSQQQFLNRIRKCRQKLARKEAMIQAKNNLMEQFLSDMRRHIASEKERHGREIKELEAEIVDIKEELRLLKEGQEKIPEPEASLDELLEVDMTESEQSLRAQLNKAKDDVKEAQNVAYAMQAQMQAFLEYQQLAAGAAVPHLATPPPPGFPNGMAPAAVMSPQKPKPPAGLMKDARAPFGVTRKDIPARESPYTRPDPPAEAPGQEDEDVVIAGMRGMD